MLRRIIVLLIISTQVQAQSFSTTIEGCEALDMTKELNSLPEFKVGKGQWTGPLQRIGNWGFQAGAIFDCNGTACKILGTHDVYRDHKKLLEFDRTSSGVFNFDPATGKTFGDRVVLSVGSNSGGITRHLFGDNAKNLLSALSQDARHFINNQGQPSLVFMNYANLGEIEIRIRTEIKCSPGECIIEDDFAIFIAYNEHKLCREKKQLLF